MTEEWEKYYRSLEEVPKGIESPRGYVKKLAKEMKEEGRKNILDLGCGFGRHLIYLVEQGFQVKGIDISQKAVQMTQEKLGEKGLKANVVQGDMKDLPFEDKGFDAVLAITVIGHATKPEIRQTVKEIHRVLKERGLFFGNLPAKGDARYNTGETIEKGETYRTREHGFGRGIKEIHSFYTEEEIRELFKNFSEIEVNLFTLKKGEIQSYEIKAIK